jgi:23S rRNA (guanosine2251-2'-O)-methyltransferase
MSRVKIPNHHPDGNRDLVENYPEGDSGLRRNDELGKAFAGMTDLELDIRMSRDDGWGAHFGNFRCRFDAFSVAVGWLSAYGVGMSDQNDIIYGAHPVEEALKNPQRKFVKLTTTLNAAERLKEFTQPLKITPQIVAPKVLDRMLGPDAVHQGMILEAKPLPQIELRDIEKSGVVVMLDQVTDPHNVGAIIRTCAAFNVTALVTTARHSAEASGVLFKAASGAYEHVPFVKVTNLARAMEEFRDAGFRLVGLDSDAEIVLGSVEKSPPLVVVLGAEGKGLRELTRKNCDVVAKLDFTGAIRSLNVSNAAAIALYALSH